MRHTFTLSNGVEIPVVGFGTYKAASLEHKIYYKFEGNAPEYISKDLQECAKMVSELDDKMLSLNEAIRECIAQQDKDQIQMNEELMNDVCRDVLGNNKEYKDSKVQEKVTEIVT